MSSSVKIIGLIALSLGISMIMIDQESGVRAMPWYIQSSPHWTPFQAPGFHTGKDKSRHDRKLDSPMVNSTTSSL